MKKEMTEIRVEVDDKKNVRIIQPVPMQENDDVIVISDPDQLDIIIKWLQEAKQEMLK